MLWTSNLEPSDLFLLIHLDILVHAIQSNTNTIGLLLICLSFCWNSWIWVCWFESLKIWNTCWLEFSRKYFCLFVCLFVIDSCKKASGWANRKVSVVFSALVWFIFFTNLEVWQIWHCCGYLGFKLAQSLWGLSFFKCLVFSSALCSLNFYSDCLFFVLCFKTIKCVFFYRYLL